MGRNPKCLAVLRILAPNSIVSYLVARFKHHIKLYPLRPTNIGTYIFAQSLRNFQILIHFLINPYEMCG